MLANNFREIWNQIFEKIGKYSIRIGIEADFWTLLGLAFSIVAGALIASGQYLAGGIFSLLMLAADVLDGAAARARNKTSVFGVILDHCVDRYAELFIYSGFLLRTEISNASVFFAISGMIMASYIRAKAESQCNTTSFAVGIAGRAEKMILTFLALILLMSGLFKYSEGVFWLIGFLSHLTAIQRLWYSYNYVQKQTE
jgi:CDP-diacylglycerol--glycerol-3-phosphate 3-phosphatidyltransferase/archaetidylinositol phosphate synthase